jgi:hypothetical protein
VFNSKHAYLLCLPVMLAAGPDATHQHTMQQLGNILNVVLGQDKLYAPQGAAAFGQLLCVSRELRHILLHGANKSVRADLQTVTLPGGDPSRPSNMLSWLQLQLQHGTLRSLLFDCCHPETSAQAAEILGAAAAVPQKLPTTISWRCVGEAVTVRHCGGRTGCCMLLAVL